MSQAGLGIPSVYYLSKDKQKKKVCFGASCTEVGNSPGAIILLLGFVVFMKKPHFLMVYLNILRTYFAADYTYNLN